MKRPTRATGPDRASRLRVLAGDLARLGPLLVSESGLPGPRANLELCEAFADVMAELGSSQAPLEGLLSWAALPASEAPTNHPREILPFAAVQALGALALLVDEGRSEQILATLWQSAVDARWRVREATAMALQRIGMGDFSKLRDLLGRWLEDPAPYRRRAVLAALAHPALLTSPERFECAFGLTDRAFRDFVHSVAEPPRVGEAWDAADGLDAEPRYGEEGEPLRQAPRRARKPKPPTRRYSEPEQALLQALQYVPSVLASLEPGLGFECLRGWAALDALIAKKIVAANLRKSRLAKAFPEQCAEVGETLGGGYE